MAAARPATPQAPAAFLFSPRLAAGARWLGVAALLATSVACARSDSPTVLAGRVEMGPQDAASVSAAGLVVPAGGVLTLLPGTRLAFDEDAEILVLGVLDVLGTEAEPVVLDAAHAGAGWNGIRLGSRGRARLEHVRVVSAGVSRACFVVKQEARLEASHLEMRDPRHLGFDLRGGGLMLRDSTFPAFDQHEVIHGFGLSAGHGLLIERCRFRPVRGFHDIIDLDSCADASWVGLIQDSEFTGGSDDAIDADACSVQVRRCTFRGFHREGHDHVASAISADFAARVDVDDSVIRDNEAGFTIKRGALVTLRRSLVAGSSRAAFVMAEGEASGGGVRLIATRLSDNAAEFERADAATLIERFALEPKPEPAGQAADQRQSVPSGGAGTLVSPSLNERTK